MKTVLFSLFALLCYAGANTVIEKKLAHVSPLANTTIIYVVLLAMSLPLVAFRDQLGIKLTTPQWPQVLLLVGCAVIFFFADLAWFQAYHAEGGRLEQVTATYLAFPIIIAMMKGFSSGALPTKSDVLSWVIVGIGLVISMRQPMK